MSYIETPIKDGVTEPNMGILLSDFSTGAIIAHLLKKHKFGLVSTWAVIITALYTMPFLPSLIASAL